MLKTDFLDHNDTLNVKEKVKLCQKNKDKDNDRRFDISDKCSLQQMLSQTSLLSFLWLASSIPAPYCSIFMLCYVVLFYLFVMLYI